MYLYDTNVFLEILLGQQNAATALETLNWMTDQRRGTIASFSLHAIEAIVGAKTNRLPVLTKFLDFISSHPFLDCYYTTIDEEQGAASAAAALKLDFDDSLQYFIAKKRGLTLVTFDKDFLKVKGIKVLLPGHSRIK